MTRTVLIIEDERKIAHWVQTYIEKAGFTTLLATDGETGLALARSEHPDLVILDLNLPGMDGLDVCRAIRRERNSIIANVPIVMLTARVEETDRLIGLELGADDYVTKPFSPKELVARVRAIFRRLDRSTNASRAIKDGELLVEVDAHMVSLGGKRIDLTPNQFFVLVALMEHRGHVLSRSRLVELAFGHDYEGLDRSVDVHIRQLREKIENDPTDPQ
jgi:two-component system alkaline phosphatase synthesis response regulator PhoP